MVPLIQWIASPDADCAWRCGVRNLLKEEAMRLREFVSSKATCCFAERKGSAGIQLLVVLCVCSVFLVSGCGKSVPAAASVAPNVQVTQVIQRGCPVCHESVTTL